MKVLQINNVYNQGSTGKITYDIHKYLLKNDIESVVCYGIGKKVNEPNVHKVCCVPYAKFNHLIANITGIMYGNFYFSTNRIISIIKKEKPDIVHLQCLNSYFVNIYRLVEWLKANKVRTVLTLHAEFMYTANCGHALDCEKWKTGCGNCPRFRKETKSFFIDNTNKSWRLMKKAFDGFDENLTVVSVSPWIMDRAKLSPILKNKNHKVILNGLDTKVFHYYNENELCNRYKINEEKIILYVTPNFNLNKKDLKGGYYIIELAKRFEKENVKILIAGSHNTNIRVPDNVILLGNISKKEELAKFYSMADVTILTSKREAFSMVTAESLCCGTPIVGFKAGAPEQIAIREYSKFVDYGNLNLLKRNIELFLNINNNKTIISEAACKIYSKDLMNSEYLKIYRGEN